MVVNKAAVVYSPASMDITNEVIRRYNTKYPRKLDADAGKGAPAPAPAPADDPKAKPKPKTTTK